MDNNFEIKYKGRTGDLKDDFNRARILSRIVSWAAEGIE